MRLRTFKVHDNLQKKTSLSATPRDYFKIGKESDPMLLLLVISKIRYKLAKVLCGRYQQYQNFCFTY